MSKVARLLISDTILLDAMRFPEDTIVLNARYDAAHRFLELVVHHNDLREVAEGEDAPIITPTFRYVAGVAPHFAMETWGQEEP